MILLLLAGFLILALVLWLTPARRELERREVLPVAVVTPTRERQPRIAPTRKPLSETRHPP